MTGMTPWLRKTVKECGATQQWPVPILPHTSCSICIGAKHQGLCFLLWKIEFFHGSHIPALGKGHEELKTDLWTGHVCPTMEENSEIPQHSQ